MKLLGITLDNKVTFQEDITKLCKKVSGKIHALSRISNYMEHNKLKILIRTFIKNEFNYCPLTWMFHNRTLNNKINKLHERALRIVYSNETSSFEDLLQKDKSFTIHERKLQKLGRLMYQVKNNLCPKIVKDVFLIREILYNLRNKCIWESQNLRTNFYGTETISFRGPKIWMTIPDSIKNSTSLTTFKQAIKRWKPSGCTCRLCRDFIPNLEYI